MNEFLLYELYHENSTLDPVTGRELGERVAAFFGDHTRQEKIDSSFKDYADKAPILLPTRLPALGEFTALLAQRQSVTPIDAAERFTGRAIDLASLAIVLGCGYGVTRSRDVYVGSRTYVRNGRSVPSGGGLYPLELYLWCGATEPDSPIAQGEFYHFHPQKNLLERIGARSASLRHWFSDPVYGQQSPPSAVIVVSGVPQRSSVKYGERAYRFVLLEAGHVMQNMLLAATGLSMSSVPIGGFYDEIVAETLGFDPSQEYPLYCLNLGR